MALPVHLCESVSAATQMTYMSQSNTDAGSTIHLVVATTQSQRPSDEKRHRGETE